MHQDINSQDISKVHACVFGPVKISLRTLHKHISIKILVVYLLVLMNENVHRGGHALTALNFFGNNALITERYGWFCFPAHFLHLHFIKTSLNNRRQSNDNDLRPNSLVKLVQKSLVGNYEPIMHVCGKIFKTNLHNLKMLFMLWMKNEIIRMLATGLILSKLCLQLRKFVLKAIRPRDVA